MTKQKLEAIFAEYFKTFKTWTHFEEPEIVLVKVVNSLRPKKAMNSVSIALLINILKNSENYLANFRAYLIHIFKGRAFSDMIIDVGISSSASFKNELFKKVSDKILPDFGNPNSMRYLFEKVLHRDEDYQWVKNINNQEISELFKLIDFPKNTVLKNEITQQIYYAISVLSVGVSGVSQEKNIRDMIPKYDEYGSPFLVLYDEIKQLFNEKTNSYTPLTEANFKKIKAILDQCFTDLDKAYESSGTQGICLKTNKDLNRIREKIRRIDFMLPLITESSEKNKTEQKTNLLYRLSHIHANRIELKEFISNASRIYALEITTHKAKTGEKYISKTKKEYFSMFKAALGGGFIVGLLCIFKVLLSKIETSDFGYAVLYSMNYALGFILIYLLGFTLATKQPAMTASTLISVIKKGMHLNVEPSIRHKEFAKYFAQLSRTQFIAFTGNIIMAFPVALLGVWAIYMIDGYDITSVKWQKLLEDIDPVESAAIFHASIAGVFLFFSGIISGYVANRNKFFKISERLSYNPFIIKGFGVKNAKRLKYWYDKKWPGISSNFWFGILMGFTASIGAFLGLNLDIRHITFASGNFALGLFGANYEISNEVIAWSLIGISLIGFFNFIVSFSLSLLLAFSAKNIPVTEIRPIVLSVLREFKTNPISFFFPPRKKRE